MKVDATLSPPSTYPNPKGDNPWDNDAVQWLLSHADVAAAFDRHNLMECARRQPKRLEGDLDRVILAARFCGQYGVDQVQVFDPKIGKQVWRLRRTDPGAPEYPPDGGRTRAMKITADDGVAAERLLGLVASYEAELKASGKTASTVFTYVDRAERFLRRVIDG